MPEACSLYLNTLRKSVFSLPQWLEDGFSPSRFLAELSPAFTPLHSLPGKASLLGLGSLYVKDESRFLNLNAFKGRGALWAVARVCAQLLDISPASLTFKNICKLLPPHSLHFVTATDGNHGAALARSAALFGQSATVFMPAGSLESRIRFIAEQGAICEATDLNYDATVRLAAQFAETNGAILLQDTAWPGYEEIPGWIMQGYSTIVDEALRQLSGIMPTHVFLQVGVGSFAASIVAAFMAQSVAHGYPAPRFISMEPENAACVYNSLLANDGEMHAVTGAMPTNMAGLACGEPSIIAWPVLKDHLFAAASCSDTLADAGMALLARPESGDPFIISGESGAIGMGLLQYLCLERKEICAALGLNEKSRVLLISTEGATDKASWEKVVGKKLPALPE